MFIPIHLAQKHFNPSLGMTKLELFYILADFVEVCNNLCPKIWFWLIWGQTLITNFDIYLARPTLKVWVQSDKWIRVWSVNTFKGLFLKLKEKLNFACNSMTGYFIITWYLLCIFGVKSFKYGWLAKIIMFILKFEIV